MTKHYLLAFFCLVGWLSNAQTITFADPAFKEALLMGVYDIDSQSIDIDTNNDDEIQISEAQLAYGITLYGSGVTNLGGIEHFTNLRNFTALYEGMISVDLSMLPDLRYISLEQTAVSSLYFNGATIRGLWLQNNNLSSFDTSPLAGNTNFTGLNLAFNQLTSIDLAPLQSCTNLASLRLNDNQLAAVNWAPLAGNTNITEINLASNEIAAFDFAQVNEVVNRVDLSYNHLSSVDFSQLNHSLEALHVENNLYDYFDTAGLSHVDTLYAGSDALHDAKFTVYDFDYVWLKGENINSIDFKNGHNESCFTVSHTCSHMQMRPRFSTFKNPDQIMCVDDFPYFSDDGSPLTDRSERNYWSLIMNGEAEMAQNPLLGPHITTYCSEEPGGAYNTIAGNIKYDCGNSNINLPQVPVRMVENDIHSGATTDLSGDYRLYTVQNNVTVTPDLENPSYFNVTPANYTYTFSATGNTETANFCLSPKGTHHNVTLSLMPITGARPGFDAQYLIAFKNNGNQIESGAVTFTFNGDILDFVSATPSVGSQTSTTLTWPFSGLGPLESRKIFVVLNLNGPMETPAVNNGDQLTFSAVANLDQTDEFPSDNQSTLNQIAVGSYDPNDKLVAEGSQVAISNAGKYLHYVIRFQNTGTAAAENVVLEDYLESDLDARSVEVISASHPYRATLTDGNQFEVFFNGINLPASSQNEPASHGYVAFKVKTRSGVTVGTVIKNKAKIHFDFNFPIVTNETSTTFSVLATQDFNADRMVTLYPNPAGDVLHVVGQTNAVESVKIYNLLGQLVQTAENSMRAKDFALNVSHLQTGNYLIRMVAAEAVSTQHFAKQ